MNLSQILGFTGIALGLLGYLPQITHLIKEKCSAGINLRAFAIWFIAAFLLLVHAAMIHDIVFTTLQTLNLVLDGVVYIYAAKYRTGICQSHLLIKGRVSV